MKVVDRGNSNLLIDYGDPNWLYRCCVRFPGSLQLCNKYTLENIIFINEKIKPILRDTLCCMELKTLHWSQMEILKDYLTNPDDEVVNLIKIGELKNRSHQEVIYKDHFTSFYGSRGEIVMEFKPKWLYSKLEYCRNCAHNNLKKRNIGYCYQILLNDPQHFLKITNHATLPKDFLEDMLCYFSRSDNILKILYDAQKKTDVQSLDQISSSADVRDELLLCMTLRDVTCFIIWGPHSSINVKVVDVDLKPREKWTHWLETHQNLQSCMNTHQWKKHSAET